ncbi:MAG: aa3-type cytochrome c oxidase subunit IV [Pseudomonadota bacterium]
MSGDMSGSSPEMDVEQHEETYNGFILATKICTVFVVLILIVLAYWLL